jgi:pimeloyl-ACP methyl ester carboxylesterase
MPSLSSPDGTRIVYDVHGSGGPALILVEGAFCGRHFGSTAKLAERLGGNLTVYHYDRRSRGDSGASTDYRIAREIEDIAALIEVAGGSAALCGFSSGACLAVEAAAAGLPVTQLAIYEPPYMVGPKARAVPPDFEREMQQLVAAGKNGEAVKYFMVKLIGMPALFWPMIRLSKMYKTLAAQAPSLPFDMAAVNGFEPPLDRLARIDVPTLAMYGSKTMPVLRDSTELCARTIPGATLKVLPGQTHEVKAEAIAPELLAFFGARQRAAA